MSQPSQNGECTDQRTEKRQKHSSYEQKQKRALSNAGDNESKDSSFPEEDPERTKHSKITPFLL